MAEGQPESGVSRDEFEALKRRVQELESRVPPPVRHWPVPEPAPAPRPAPPLPASVPLPSAPRPAPAPPAAPTPRPPAPPRPAVSMETLLGQRFAPRVGAVLVFLATLFFLGVGIQRGYIGPIAQLAIATLGAFVLLGVAHWLTTKKGYESYPQVLEGTAACILYATAFVAHALPYYRRATGLTDVGGGVLMALVALGTVALALWRDAPVIVRLGYGLAFLTAMVGWGILPDLTVAYVGVLGVSLAALVWRKNWTTDALLGTLVTGALFVGFAFDALDAPPSPWFVLLSAAPAFGAFLWLSLRPHGDELAPALGTLTLAWAVLVSLSPAWGDATSLGVALALWCAAAAGLAVAAAMRQAARGVALGFGVAAVVLYIVSPWLLFESLRDARLAITLTYAVGALSLVTLQRAFPRVASALWNAGLALAAAAAVKAVFLDERFPGFGGAGTVEAWVTFLFVAPTLALLTLLAPRGTVSGPPRLAFVLGVGFLALWAFALFQDPFAVTLYLLAVGLALVAAARRAGGLASSALLAGFVIVGIAAVKAAVYDVTIRPGRPEWWLAAIEIGIVAGSLLALHHLRLAPQTSRNAPPVSGTLAAGSALVGGSALVVATYLLQYVEGPSTSVLLGLLGVAYLVGGFLRARDVTYRYTGFAVLGFVLLRVFTVDLREADLVVRALVFLVLGGILLGVGYVYARMNRAKTQAPSTEAAEPAER